ncbi:hypothetical protein GCM10007977_016760 [Dactylosporangium sucinum]|uniref:EcsC protein family protein n=1 Tax=Dactylosporangium sucinum TaxID=1424081 RepID=A0A917TBG6_9ACTN|nr:hypothetical protein GCM10007977_016760 [Dactylosporangium sucinum]
MQASPFRAGSPPVEPEPPSRPRTVPAAFGAGPVEAPTDPAAPADPAAPTDPAAPAEPPTAPKAAPAKATVKKAAPKKAAVKKAVVKKAAPPEEVVTAEADRVQVTRAAPPAAEVPAPREATARQATKKAVKKTMAKPAVQAEQLDLLGDEPVPVEKAVKKAARKAVKTASAKKAVAEEPVVEVAPEPEQFNTGSIGVNPAYLPELLALAAVRRLGAEARRRVGWYRATYPTATSDAVARAVTREFVRRARLQGAAAGAAGAVGLVAEGAALGWLQARLVLHLAAAYGHDPLDPERAAELLVIQRVHGSVETAEAAIRAAQHVEVTRPASPGVGPARLGAPIVRAVGGGLVRAVAARLARRVVPGAGLVVGAVTAARAMELLAARAVRHYRR